MKSFLLVLAVCACAAAMVSRDRRAVNSEEVQGSTTETSTVKPFCEPQTTCSWTFYDKNTKLEKLSVPNQYCVCSPELDCSFYENNEILKAYFYRCQQPVAQSEITGNS